MRATWLLLALGIFSTAILSGCGSSDRVRVFPVTGTVTFEGKSMPGGGTTMFVPLQKQIGKAAAGEIREDGSYNLTTYSPGDGSMPGEFRVVIVQAVSIEPQQAPPDGQQVPKDGVAGITVAPEDQIPAIYSDSIKSPLKTKVEEKANELNFDLKRSVEAEGSPPPGVASRQQSDWSVVVVCK
jgi:hypothetical protein